MKSSSKAQLPSAVFPHNNSPGDLISSSVEIISDPNRGLLLFQQWSASFPNTALHLYLSKTLIILIKNQTFYIVIKSNTLYFN